jgi:glycerol-3-phosphate responsive antiterminator
MPLTTEDLSQIKGIVNEVISEVVPGVVNEVVHGIVQEAVAPLATKEELYETKQEIMDELAKKADKADLVGAGYV